ncbi:UvrD-helicase domain-containing protein [Agromyces salentinus]|uniref:DNA 3'-5' helicase n=1 Tax=Agromyces salentinus TaxID=269421 RepID=A0ABN2MLB5_9MICO|nr:UvrD-helicase domain-containing protein [Agromyces salentinus]
MPNLIMTKLKGQDHEKAVRAKIMSFLSKLTEDDTLPGLHIEPMNEPLDSRARTGRVDIHLRAVLYCLEPLAGERTYVYAGTWEHEEAIKRARTRKLQINPVNGIAELIEAEPAVDAPAPAAPKVWTESAQAGAAPSSFLTEKSYFVADLTDEFGFPADLAAEAFAAATEDELLAFASDLENEWQSGVLLGMAMNLAISQIKESLGITEADDNAVVTEPAVADEVAEPDRTEDERLVEALKHPAAQMQFTFIEGEEELQRVIDGGDFGAWRVFLHPDQRRYATRSYKGPFRLTGGAGTGKTVVLLHRAKHLAEQHPTHRVVLTTYTRALADNLRRDLERLDPDLAQASAPGHPGVLVRGVDQLVAAVRDAAGTGFGAAAQSVLGAVVESRGAVVANDSGWDDAVDDADVDLPAALRSKSFLSVEYLQVILANRIVTKDDYFTVRRPGRGVALDRAKRAQVWAVVEQYRKNARIANRLSFAEVASVSAAWLEGADGESPRTFADHILIDEAQDLTPSHWRFLRAVTASGPDDMFIADDTHQRIYGQPVVLSRLDIAIVGRSRRLTLNYRTTEQNLRYALGLLEGGTFIDAQGGEEGVAGYRSSRLGPEPKSLPTQSASVQFAVLAAQVKSWLDAGVDGATIAVLTTSNNAAKDVHDALDHHGVASTILTNAKQSGDRPVILTMHIAKGLEFSRVILFDISEGSFPTPWSLKGVAAEDRDDVMLRERSLLYVAASRARDELVVTWKGKPSELLLRSE